MEPVNAEPVLAALPGVGPKTATLLIGAFGTQALQIIEFQPERMCEVTGVGPKRAQAIHNSWQQHRHVATAQAKLTELGLAAGQRKAAYRRWGEGAASLLTRSPYRLAELRGQGFAAADQLALSVGTGVNDPARITAAVNHLLRAAENQGHTFMPLSELVSELAQLQINVTEQRLSEVLEHIQQKGHITLSSPNSGEIRIAMAWMDAAEAKLSLLATAACEGHPAPTAIIPRSAPQWLSLTPTEEQWQAITAALMSRLSLIVGKPGTGKSQSMRLLCETAEHLGFKVALCAPTGKAAKRLEQLTGRPATTVHRLLQLRPGMTSAPVSPDAELVVCDEASMLDVPLAAYLMEACRSSRLVLCGDADQLPAVGAGRVLDDLVSSGRVPCVQLQHIFRQAAQSMIVQGAHHINRGQLPPLNARKAAAAAGLAEGAMNHDFFMVERIATNNLVSEALALATSRLPRALNVDATRDVMVLCAQHHGPAGTIEMGRQLQQLLNPYGEPVPGTKLRVGDRLIHTANDNERDLMNGEICQLLSHSEGMLELLDSQNRKVMLPVGDGARQLQLAYALTVHRAQGSSAPVVVAMLPQGAPLLATRNLLYTAITRAERMCVLVCHPAALKSALTRQAGARRRSTLAERLAHPSSHGRLC